jgi:hypothetical protein
LIDVALTRIAGELQKSAKFAKWAKGVSRKPPPKDALCSAAGPAEADDSQALIAAIRGRRAEQGSAFLDSLAEKYGGGEGRKRGTAAEEPAAQTSARRSRRR